MAYGEMTGKIISIPALRPAFQHADVLSELIHVPSQQSG